MGTDDDARRRLGDEGDGAGQRGGIAGIDANGHEPRAAYASRMLPARSCRRRPRGGRVGSAVAERSVVVVDEVEADQLAFAVPGKAPGDIGNGIVDTRRSGARWPRRRDRGRAATAASWSGPSAISAQCQHRREAAGEVRPRRHASRVPRGARAQQAAGRSTPAMKSAMPAISSREKTGRPRPSAAMVGGDGDDVGIVVGERLPARRRRCAAPRSWGWRRTCSPRR